MDLNTPVDELSRAHKMFARRLEKLGIKTVEDFLYHIPFRYEDFSLVSKIGQIQAGEIVTVTGKVKEFENVYTRRWKTFQKAEIQDETGIIKVIWFNQPFLSKVIKKGEVISLSGKVALEKSGLILQSPEYEVIYNNQNIHTGRLVPIYSETRGISSKWLRRQIFNILSQENIFNEYLPEKLIKENNLISLNNAIRTIHFPSNLEEAQIAKKRLAFDELFQMQLSSLIRKESWKKEKINPWTVNKKKINELIKSFPFELTKSQQQATDEIMIDISKETPMNRLLEGDVGSGKTVIAIISMYIAFLNGFQSAFMAPTEILANQHFKTVEKFLSNLDIKIGLVTGATKSKGDNFDILIGTHALVYKNRFKNLGLAIIDEQQRFGVEQRGILRNKGKNIHVLTMTATPIPRTVALALYGDLDLSILTDMPKGRIKIKTWLVPSGKREGAYTWIGKKINEGDQAFIICPFIEVSESLVTVKAATKEFERLSKEVFPNLSLGLLHGKLSSKEKESILKDFRNKKIDILVSTPVVEVGIDIPNATIMMIEEAERFGLAQLHQLRGRVGRGEKESYCLLFTQAKNPTTIERLKSLETNFSGAQLAEIDLKLRGPGQLYGTLQHGVPSLKIASFSDFELIEKTKKDALKVFPALTNFPELSRKISNAFIQEVSPD